MKLLYATNCNKCGKLIGIDHYPFNASPDYKDDINRELALKVSGHQKNLCNRCRYEFANCQGDPKFGDCLGNDNVIECSKWDPMIL